MSYLVLDVMAEYTDRTTGNRQIRAQLIADTAADLPANSTALTWLLGSYAKAVDTGKEYYIDSGGTWILQPSNNAFDNVYTKTEMDSIINPMLSDIDTQEKSLSNLIDSGGKNTLKYTLTDLQSQNAGGGYGFTWADNVCTSSRGVVFIVNSDMSIRVHATAASGDVWFLLENHAYSIGDWILSGCPTDGGTTKYYIESDSQNARDIGNSVQITAASAFSDNVYIVVKSGQTFDLTFKPMICDKTYYDISPDFVPYCPSLAELYALVRSYHP